MPVEPSYLARIRKKYNDIGEIWDRADRWHAWSKRQIDQEMNSVLTDFQKTATGISLIVDVGSGGNPMPTLRPDIPCASLPERSLKSDANECPLLREQRKTYARSEYFAV